MLWVTRTVIGAPLMRISFVDFIHVLGLRRSELPFYTAAAVSNGAPPNYDQNLHLPRFVRGEQYGEQYRYRWWPIGPVVVEQVILLLKWVVGRSPRLLFCPYGTIPQGLYNTRVEFEVRACVCHHCVERMPVARRGVCGVMVIPPSPPLPPSVPLPTAIQTLTNRRRSYEIM